MTALMDSGLPSPGRIFELVNDCAAQRQGELVIFWVQWPGDRSELARSLRAYSADIAIIPLVVREALFENPNTVMMDFGRVLLAHQAEITDLSASYDAFPSRIVVILIGRTHLRVPQISSPVVLPSWFPRMGDRTVHCIIEDLDASASL